MKPRAWEEIVIFQQMLNNLIMPFHTFPLPVVRCSQGRPFIRVTFLVTFADLRYFSNIRSITEMPAEQKGLESRKYTIL